MFMVDFSFHPFTIRYVCANRKIDLDVIVCPCSTKINAGGYPRTLKYKVTDSNYLCGITKTLSNAESE